MRKIIEEFGEVIMLIAMGGAIVAAFASGISQMSW